MKNLWWIYILQKGSDNINELYHYGILGQRWGIRRYQRKDGTLTTAGKKRYGNDIVFNKGDVHSHLSTQKNIQLKNRSSYVISKPNDMKVYGGTYASALYNKQIKQGNKKPKVYAHVFKNKHSGIIAGEETMRNMFDRMMNKHRDLMIDSMKNAYWRANRDGLIKDKTPWDDFKKDNDRMFELFNRSVLNNYSVVDSRGSRKKYLHEPEVIIGEMFVKALQRKKYAGMLDLNDKGIWYGAEQPTIIFNGKKYLEDSYIKELPLSQVTRLSAELRREGRVSKQTEPM